MSINESQIWIYSSFSKLTVLEHVLDVTRTYRCVEKSSFELSQVSGIFEINVDVRVKVYCNVMFTAMKASIKLLSNLIFLD